MIKSIFNKILPGKSQKSSAVDNGLSIEGTKLLKQMVVDVFGDECKTYHKNCPTCRIHEAINMAVKYAEKGRSLKYHKNNDIQQLLDDNPDLTKFANRVERLKDDAREYGWNMKTFNVSMKTVGQYGVSGCLSGNYKGEEYHFEYETEDALPGLEVETYLSNKMLAVAQLQRKK